MIKIIVIRLVYDYDLLKIYSEEDGGIQDQAMAFPLDLSEQPEPPLSSSKYNINTKACDSNYQITGMPPPDIRSGTMLKVVIGCKRLISNNPLPEALLDHPVVNG